MNVRTNKNEDLRILQQERLILQICLHIDRLMTEQNVSKSELANRLGVTPPRITQILDGVNLGLRQVSDVMLALDSSLVIDTTEIGFNTSLEQRILPNFKFDSFNNRLGIAAWKNEAI